MGKGISGSSFVAGTSAPPPAGPAFAQSAAPAHESGVPRHQVAALNFMVGAATQADHVAVAAWQKESPSAQGAAFMQRHDVTTQAPSRVYNPGMGMG